MKKLTNKNTSQNQQCLFPNIWSHMAHKKIKYPDGHSPRRSRMNIQSEIRGVQKSIDQTIKSLQKLEASLGKHKTISMRNDNKRNFKFRTEASIEMMSEDDQDASLGQFYRNINKEKDRMRKLDKNKSNKSSYASLTKIKTQSYDERLEEGNNELFNLLKNLLDKHSDNRNINIAYLPQLENQMIRAPFQDKSRPIKSTLQSQISNSQKNTLKQIKIGKKMGSKVR